MRGSVIAREEILNDERKTFKGKMREEGALKDSLNLRDDYAIQGGERFVVEKKPKECKGTEGPAKGTYRPD